MSSIIPNQQNNVMPPLPALPTDQTKTKSNTSSPPSLTERADSTITQPTKSKPLPSIPQRTEVSQAHTAQTLFSSQTTPSVIGQTAAVDTTRGLLKAFKEEARGKLDNNPKLTALDHEKNARFDPEKLVDRLILKHKDPVKVLAAVINIFNDDKRFNNDTDAFEFSKEDRSAVLKCLNQKIEENPSLQGKKPLSENKLKKLEKDIAFDLVGLVTRVPTTKKASDGTAVVQTHGHVEGDQFIPGRAVSANLGNTEQKLTETPNQAIVATKEEVWVNRSARTNTKDKIFDKSTAGITAMLNTTSKKGLKAALDSSGQPIADQGGRPIYTTCRSDVTLMDLNLTKSLYTTVKSGFTSMTNTIQGKRGIPVESERAFVQSKRKMAHTYWKENGTVGENGRYYIDRQMKLKGADGVEQDICVREYEPMVFNFAFSAQAKSPANVKAAREDNISGALNLLKESIGAHPNLSKYSLLLKNDPPSKFELQQLKDWINADIDKNTLSPKEELGLRGLLVTLTGKDHDGTNYDNVDGADVQFILLSHLSDLAGSPISVECKSGNDRTATAVSILCALKDYEMFHGKPYDPKIDPKDQTRSTRFNQFKESFNDYMVAFTPPNLRASRGLGEGKRPDVKSKTSPAATKYLDMKRIQSVLNVV